MLSTRHATESRLINPSTVTHGSRQRNVRIESIMTAPAGVSRTMAVSRSFARSSTTVAVAVLAVDSTRRSLMPRSRMLSASAARSRSSSETRRFSTMFDAAALPAFVR